MKEESRLSGVMRGVSPCKNCEERFTACWGKCPKDARGEYGYVRWKAEAEKVSNKQRAYMEERNMMYEEEKRRKKW
jgi:hypothetical protein